LNRDLTFKLRLLIGAILLLIVPGGQTFPAAAQETPLASGDAALLVGDYEAAIGAYTSASGDPSALCPALYGLGVSYFRAGQMDNADANFSRYLTECEQSFRALILRGEVRQQQGRPSEAVSDYLQALSINPGVLDTYLNQRIAALDLDQSVGYLRRAAEADRHPEGKVALREELAEIYLLIGSPSAALSQYEAILSEIEAYLTTLSAVEGAEYDKSGEIRARIERAAAQIQIANGQAEAGYARLQRVITTFWDTSSALPALITLVNSNRPVDVLARMRINVLNENYTPVVDVLTDYLSDPATAQSAPAELHVLLGRAQRGAGDAEGALATFAGVRAQFPNDPMASVAALEEAETYAQNGDAAGTVTAYQEVVSSYPQLPEAPQALLRAAQILRQQGDVDAALTLYDQLATQYAGTEQAQQGLQEAAPIARASDPARAAEFFGRVGTSRGFLEQGDILQEIGDTAGAQQAWRRATAAEPGTFFAMRACELLNNRAPFTASTTLEILPITDADRAAAEQWVAQTFGLENVSAALPPELESNPILRRGTELWSVGLWDEARAEFDALHKQMRNNPAALLQLAFYYQSIPVYRSSVYAATRLAFLSEVPFTQIPRAILQLAYPYYYGDLITAATQQYGLDPLLLAALIRQETSFDATATSFADARGLLQFVPATAQDVADRLGQTDYTENDLFRPMVSVPFGAYYLSSMRDFQDGSIPGALLSYNAGPGAALSWLTEAGADLERLYDTIDFAETRLYLEIIYENYTVYQHLYGGGVPGCMLEGTPEQTSGV
jgi:soluble lytic murein transglycosylase